MVVWGGAHVAAAIRGSLGLEPALGRASGIKGARGAIRSKVVLFLVKL